MKFGITPSNTQLISDKMAAFRKSKNILYLFSAALLAIRQRRLLEITYGVLCFLLHKPSKIADNHQFQYDVYNEELKTTYRLVREQIAKVILDLSARFGLPPRTFNARYHAYLKTGKGFVLGEYSDNSARIFIKHEDEFVINEYYQSVPGVRHIHSILKSDESLFVSTGDGNKFLDKWQFQDGKMKFEKRIFYKLGGFTACCKIKDKHFFGSDFSERPNYILCLETGEKWFFPLPAYTQLCYLMFPIDDRYICCLNSNLWTISRQCQRTKTIFDTKLGLFVLSQIYTDDDFTNPHDTPGPPGRVNLTP
jgi:hypothetical protein